ncbi:MAG: Gfo/Idh/MocA family oxidoreductase [Leptospiraceae bacterium]|nr:Gfo/Idh/MocA family oxidoreductase [Leptospiraceae bacterium]
MTERKVRIAILGAGDRGTIYGKHLQSAGAHIVAICDANPRRAEYLASILGAAYSTERWQNLLKQADQLDAVVIATPDAEHLAPAMAFADCNVSVLLEKPVGLTVAQLNRWDRQLHSMRRHRNNAVLMGCHVLRHSQFFSTIQREIRSGSLGELRSILHCENVSYYHFAHSYVRGNWNDSRKSSPVLLAKCSHDFDLIGWFADSRAASISANGSVQTFARSQEPQGAADRCLDGCSAHDCRYHAKTMYLDGLPLKREVARARASVRRSRIYLVAMAFLGQLALKAPWIFRLPGLQTFSLWKHWPTSTIVSGPVTRESVLEALRTGPYGGCVYRTGSDQPDHVDSLIEFENGVTAVLRMNANSFQEGRTIRIDGSEGTLEGRFGQGGDLVLHRHDSTRSRRIPVQVDLAGHAEADRSLALEFLRLLNLRKGFSAENGRARKVAKRTGASARSSLLDAPAEGQQTDYLAELRQADANFLGVVEGHRLALLAEKSRTAGKTIFR